VFKFVLSACIVGVSLPWPGKSVTFRDPETSRLKSQFSSEGFLANCH